MPVDRVTSHLSVLSAYEHGKMLKAILSPSKCDRQNIWLWFFMNFNSTSFSQVEGIENWPWDFGKRITEHRNCWPAIFSNHLIHSLNKMIGLHSFASLTSCIMNVLLKSSCTIAALCCHLWKFHRTHYSFFDEFRLHCSPTHKEIELQHAIHIWQERLLF